ncbi:molybdopterin molybdotransferase MoeA [Halomicroarcula limicola]|uniref:Molybdopterin molybdotransferase MoeA n=1 Tax=Haloarcula limicola TaxID=1429915 RepID=A0A8J7Y400_9EURY|nr:molybdopterin molybdotransferase MoeA [Halomicroarcula limicola]MBV0923777.1 molybdopterin molybdotransferase MoeA [Halomicroarcula limicola]
MTDRQDAGFREHTPLSEALARFDEQVSPHGRTETVPVAEADERWLAAALTARRDVPGEARAAMDGYAVLAEDTLGASERAPVVLDRNDRAGQGRATPVHTGSELPAGADAVVRVERTEDRGGDVAVRATVAPGENVAPAGEDVAAGTDLFGAGHRLTPADLAVAKSTGHQRLTVAERPRVSVVPTGEELVEDDPGPGQTVETNALMVSRLAERWGGTATYRDIVTDDANALGEAIERDTDHDVVVTTGGSSVGERDLLPEVVDDRGEMRVHGVAIKPGHPLGFGVVDGTPILVLPGYPVSCLVGAVSFLRPAIAWLAGAEPDPIAETTATLTERIHSDLGTTQFVRVGLDDGDATPVRASGAGVLSSAVEADGWVVVGPETEVLDVDATVTVERWP